MRSRNEVVAHGDYNQDMPVQAAAGYEMELELPPFSATGCEGRAHRAYLIAYALSSARLLFDPTIFRQMMRVARPSWE